MRKLARGWCEVTYPVNPCESTDPSYFRCKIDPSQSPSVIGSLSQTRTSFPQSVTCLPEGWYSGGFKIFYIEVKVSEDGANTYIGHEYWQETLPHGQKFGKPKETGQVPLDVSIQDDRVQILGFHDGWDALKPLVMPHGWWDSGREIRGVRSELFYNDLLSNGHCVVGKHPILASE